MKSLQQFYNTYHKKNDDFFKVITGNNFTYFYLLDFFRKNQIFVKNKTILDVGCGVGTLSLYFSSRGARLVVGLDISDRAINIAENARRSLNFKNVFFRNAELSKKILEFDVVLCSEVIEHIKNDAEFLRSVHKNLKYGGVLALTTPSLDNMLYKTGYYRKFDQQVGHLRRYTQNSLSALLESSGFEVKDIRSVEGPLRNILFTSKLGFLIKFIRGPLIPLFHFIDTIFANFFGATDIQVIAIKSPAQ